jgi:23S rRNA (adenine2503-C2)-methyltransferase
MKLMASRGFRNGHVYALSTSDGYPLEVTETFLPMETKFCQGGTNAATRPGSRAERWMIGVSCMSGCPVGCGFCATGSLPRWRKLTSSEIVSQVLFAVAENPDQEPDECGEFKINYTRMGEPFLNLGAVRGAMERISRMWPYTHHYISTIGIKGSDFSWIEGNTTLQISLHSLDEERRHELIPFGNALMSIEELGQIRTRSKLKTTINLTLVDLKDFDVEKLKRLFDPEHFFIKISPINPNEVSEANGLGLGVVGQHKETA